MSAADPCPRFVRLLLLVISGLIGFACGPARYRLMPTPNMLLGDTAAFDNVPESLRTSWAEVLFATDRFPEQANGADRVYFKWDRSPYLYVGTMRMNIGTGLTWDEVVAHSTSAVRGPETDIHFGEPDILVRYPGNWWHMARIEDPSRDYEHFQQRRLAARESLHDLLRPRLEVANRKHVYLFVHGYNNTLEDAVLVIAGLWHFMGRDGVPIAYSWPAAAGGLTGYTTDRESGEFTIFHFKMFLEDLAAMPEVEEIHILSHSRGTDVTTTGLRELILQIRGGGREPREELKISNLVLASPDIDVGVASQRLLSERIPEAVGRLTIYVSPTDNALWISKLLQGGLTRLGLLDIGILSPEQLQVFTYFGHVNLIDSRVTSTSFGHDYFYSNPAASSDLILLLRDNRAPGIRNGRPLIELAPNLWRMRDGYPGSKESILESITGVIAPSRRAMEPSDAVE